MRDDCLQGFHEIRNNSEAYANYRIIAARTFGVVYLNTSTSVFSPVNIASHIKNLYFSLQGTKKLFHVFALDNHITIDDAVVDDAMGQNKWLLPGFTGL
jgi:hypothetical protein